MCRSFLPSPLPPGAIDDIVDLATRAPSAGRAQGLRVVCLEGVARDTYWDLTLPEPRRATFRWQRLLNAPTLLLVFADPDAYVARYGEPDKRHTGWGESTEQWTTPYWTVDAAMAVMVMLLAAEERGFGALFFALANGEAAVRHYVEVPAHLQTIGVVALGYPDTSDVDALGRGRSASRPRLGADQVMRRFGNQSRGDH
jgi:nitroreductase